MSAPQIEILTFKEGVLSKVAHDLRITAEEVHASLEGEAIKVRVNASALRVACARKDGRDDHRALSSKDKSKIEKSMRSDVLNVGRFPFVDFEGSAEREDTKAVVSGSLSLHGVTRDISLTLTRRGEFFEGHFDLHQPDFGIKPFTAMLGALKVQPRVRVVVRVAT